MNFEDLVRRLKKINFDEIRKDFDGYFEFVVRVNFLFEIYPLFENYYGVPFKPAGIAPTPDAENVTRNYGGIQTQQTLYYAERNGGISDCAMIWPWNDGQHATVKMARGMIGG